MGSEDLNIAWEKVCQLIKENNLVDWNQFSSVKNQLEPQAMSDGFFLLTISTKFLAVWSTKNFAPAIKSALKTLYGRDYIVEITENEISSSTSEKEEEKERIDSFMPLGINNSFEKIEINKEPSQIKQEYITEKEKTNINSSIAPSLTFSNFVIGESNRLAYSMAVQVAETPGNQALNPLFIYGRSGLGKTHLLRAIQNDILQTHQNLVVIYVDTNDLISDFTTAAASHDREKMSFVSFKEKYESADVLLIDDVQFLQGKKQTLDIVFQILNTLITQGKQIVLSADRSPKVIDIDERYTSRFIQGGTCDIQPPETETKIAIVKKYIEEYNETCEISKKVNIPEEIIDSIAKYSSSNIRELKGAVTMITYKCAFNSNKLDISEIKKTLINHFTSTRVNITVDDIQRVVEEYYKVSHIDLVGKTRAKKISYARQICFYLCRVILDIPYIELGRKFNRDHATVLYAVNKIEQEMLTNREIEEDIETLKTIIKDL